MFVQKVIDVATSADLPGGDRRRDLFRSVGIDSDAPVDPKQMVSDKDYYALCERVTREDPHGASVPIRVGSSMRCDDYGAFGLAWKSAIDLRGSYQRSERYARVLTSVSTYAFLEENGAFYMALNRAGERHLGMRLSNEQSIVAVTQISREVSQQPFSPDAVYFKHSGPDDLSAHESYFGCPVHFNADRDAIRVSKDHLVAPNKLGDPSISTFFDSHMEKEIAELPEVQELDGRVRNLVSRALSEGVPNVADVAARLGLSARTLQRRLAAQGHAFQDLVDEARQDLAIRLLRRTDYALAEVAFLTGFAEQSAFTRAFKRWRGETPASYRRTVQHA
ncbi:AraC family transcriptional regulator ligand-binding domain-containing protein [Roseibium sp. HPY-6]|uniref:AraC family transcriptional regulator n=1 Tax=Roseibium sp. HPY-6 TaxID=3229852 RepID=UPI00338EF52F